MGSCVRLTAAVEMGVVTEYDGICWRMIKLSNDGFAKLLQANCCCWECCAIVVVVVCVSNLISFLIFK